MASILQAIGSVITTVITWVIGVINGAVPLFYDASATGTDKFTFLGTLLLVGFAIGMVWVGLKFVRGLVRRA